MRVTQILIGNLEPPIKKARYWNDGEEEEESVGNNDDMGAEEPSNLLVRAHALN